MTPQKLTWLAFGLSISTSVLGRREQSRLEEGEDATSFLQQDFRLGRENAAALRLGDGMAVAHLAAPADAQPVPLGVRVVNFNAWVYLPVSAFWILLFVHEWYVSKHKQIFIRSQALQRKACQILTIWSSFSGFIVSAMVIPLSFDFALSLGQSASASGLFMGIQLIAGLAGTLAGRPLVSETAWSQFFVRRLIITSFFFCSFMSLALGCFYNWTARSSQGDFIWWSGLVILAVTAFVGSLTSVAVQVLWTKTTHPANRTVWTFMSQCCRSGGMSLGPIIFSVVSSAIVSGGDPVSPRSMMAWVQIFALYLSIISLAFVTFMPTQLPPVLPPAPAGSVEEDPRLSGEAQPEELEDPAREAVYWKMIYHFLERPFTLAAIEVSTTMMLEVLYGWDVYHSGFCFTIMCPAGIVLAMVTKVLINTGYMRETSVYFSAMMASVVGCALLFDEGHAGPRTLIAAGTVIYTGAALANSIADGWGSRAAKEGTSFGQAQFQLLKLLAISVTRFIGDLIGRFLVDFGGRNTYAGFQLLLCSVGAHTAYRACRPLWAMERQGKEPEEEGEAWKFPRAPEDSPNPSEAFSPAPAR